MAKKFVMQENCELLFIRARYGYGGREEWKRMANE
jgi:hypothetical protein